MTRWLLIAGVGMALAGLPACAQEATKTDPAKAEKKSDGDPFAALQKERAELRTSMIKKYREAKEDEQEKIYAAWQKADKEFQTKLTALAFQNAATQPAYEFLVMALTQGGENAAKAKEDIVKYHLDKPYAHEKNAFLIMLNAKGGTELVEVAEAKNPDPLNKAVAAFSLGVKAKQEVARSEGDKKQALIKKAEAAFARVAKYDDGKSKQIKSQVAQAKGQLAGLKNIEQLQVGKAVPDIDGVDLDGKAFKLSDYKGKVILLDYWAFW